MKITTSIKAATSEIIFAKKRLGEILLAKPFSKKSRYAIVTDKNIARIYRAELKNLPNHISVHIIPAGESSKKMATIEHLAQLLLTQGITKSDTIVGLGGGMITDISGLLASLYMRGTALIQIPTTLLAMCDAAIGGKNGVSTPLAKNLLGTINQPKTIIIQTEFLRSLPGKEIKNGIAEVIKYAVTLSKKLFAYIEQNERAIKSKNPAVMKKIIKECIHLKKTIVEKDTYEASLRRVLNYGHSIGHALEEASGYTIAHGEAVSIGMCLENELALNNKIIQKASCERIKYLCEAFQLPTEIDRRHLQRMKNMIRYDKKRSGNIIHMYLPTSIGTSKPYEISVTSLQHLFI